MTGMVGTDSRTMADLISLAAARHGGRPALKHKLGGEWVEVSYEQLDRTVTELALGLVDLGIEPGDRVSILSHTRPEWTYACFATFAAGAIVASIYQTNSAEECHYVLHHSGARAVFVEDAEQLAKVRAVQADLPALEFVIVIEPADADGSTLSLEVLLAEWRLSGGPARALRERCAFAQSGVLVTNVSPAANERLIKTGSGHSPKSTWPTVASANGRRSRFVPITSTPATSTSSCMPSIYEPNRTAAVLASGV